MIVTASLSASDFIDSIGINIRLPFIGFTYGYSQRLCCIMCDELKLMITWYYYATRMVLGVPICEKRLRIAARTLSSVIWRSKVRAARR